MPLCPTPSVHRLHPASVPRGWEALRGKGKRGHPPRVCGAGLLRAESSRETSCAGLPGLSPQAARVPPGEPCTVGHTDHSGCRVFSGWARALAGSWSTNVVLAGAPREQGELPSTATFRKEFPPSPGAAPPWPCPQHSPSVGSGDQGPGPSPASGCALRSPCFRDQPVQQREVRSARRPARPSGCTPWS